MEGTGVIKTSNGKMWKQNDFVSPIKLLKANIGRFIIMDVALKSKEPTSQMLSDHNPDVLQPPTKRL